jgi:MoxR-like ATPase
MSEQTQLLDKAQVEQAAARCGAVLDAVNSVILGRPELVRLVFATVLARGHALLEGLPGLGKTVLVRSFAAALSLKFTRVQFTPDLLPADITGSHMLEETPQGRHMKFFPGPVFTNLLLADEINRASPKTQAALLEAMSEGQVTQMGTTMELEQPFSVLATQNPIELEGTYPLPEAQLDRFAVKVDVRGTDRDVLRHIITTRRDGRPRFPDPVMDKRDLLELQGLVDDVMLPHAVAEHICSLVAATDPAADDAPPDVSHAVRYGASPRAAIWLAQVGKALALIDGRPGVGFEDVAEAGPAVLGHRLVLQHAARLDGETGRALAGRLIAWNERRIIGA